MQYKAFETGIEVSGKTVHAFVDGLEDFESFGGQYMSNAGIGVMKKGKWQLDLDGWYPQQVWLDALAIIALEVGDAVLFKIGLAIPPNVEPSRPAAGTIQEAIRAIDVNYHINHRKNGICMYDAATDTMLEGIGHYSYKKMRGKNVIIAESRTPNPCAFDWGLITAVARKRAPEAIVIHDDSKPCRKTGEESCTFLVSWGGGGVNHAHH